MKKRSLIVVIATALSVVFVFAGVYATQEPAETMTMQSKLFEPHTKALVTFTHKKHNVDYKIACADCHHVYQEGKNVWKQGDEVRKCDACHAEAKAPKGEKMDEQEEIKKYYYSAIHENCVGCHKALKKEAKPTGPTTCKDCHPKAQ